MRGRRRGDEGSGSVLAAAVVVLLALAGAGSLAGLRAHADGLADRVTTTLDRTP